MYNLKKVIPVCRTHTCNVYITSELESIGHTRLLTIVVSLQGKRQIKSRNIYAQLLQVGSKLSTDHRYINN